MNIEQEFLEWKNKVYGNKELSENHILQLKVAFISGAFITVYHIEEISGEESEDIAEVKLFNLVTKVKKIMKELIIKINKREEK